jgi:pimeloyl-ACP methyl ester carboxylesterase
MALVRVGEAELDVERGGSGPPLLLIMGMSGTALHWGEPFLQALREDFDVIAYDHRGVGASTHLDGEITIVEMAEDAAGLLEALGVEAAHVVGFSMGGMIAQELALAHPERVLTLTLAGTYCGGEGSTSASPEVTQRLAEAMMSGDRARALRAGWEINVSPAYGADEQAWERFVQIADERAVAVPVVLAQLRACMAHDTKERLAGIELPTLVIHGSLDQMIPVENGRMIASLMDGSRLEIFDGVGHLFCWEAPERGAQLVRSHAAVHA